MPSFNYAHTIEKAISSVLGQTYPHFELIIADDGSIDKSPEIIETWRRKFPDRIKFSAHPSGAHQGLAATYKLALSQARGSVIAFLEADDYWLPDNLRIKVEAMNAFPDAGAVYTRVRPFGDKLPSLYWRFYALANHISSPKHKPFSALPVLLKRNPCATFSNFALRKEFMEECPPPPEGLLYFDWWVLAHAAVKKPFIYIPVKTVCWKIHRSSANYGRFGRKEWRRLIGFLYDLTQSLERAARNAEHQGSIRRIRFQCARRRRWTKDRKTASIFFSYVNDPLDGIRFLFHIFLKNLLMR